MPTLRLVCPWLPWIFLAACQGDTGSSGGGQAESGTGATSTSTTGPDRAPSGLPTTSASSSSGLADAESSTSSSGAASTGEDPSDTHGDSLDLPATPCGNGQPDPGEECDLGALNDDEGVCTYACTNAVCGDALVHAGVEDCDNGVNNNDSTYGGCGTNCDYGPRCGDGEVQSPEECDLGATDNGTGKTPQGVICEAGCRYHARIAFLSSTTYKGGEIGGVEAAHAACRALAKLAKFDNSAKFMAWIGDGAHSPAQDFEHGPAQDDLPYVLPNGVLLAANWDDLIQNGPGHGIVVTEANDGALFDQGVWTGTAANGEAFVPGAHCGSWGGASGKGRIGRSGIDEQEKPVEWAAWKAMKQWSGYLDSGCLLSYRLYCFEQ